MHYLLFYDVAKDYPTKRVPFRSAHLEYAWQAVERGELVLAGALANPVDGAVFLFRGSSPAVAEAFAAGDPYVHNGVVLAWRVREWTTVVGPDAATPVRLRPPDKRLKLPRMRAGHGWFFSPPPLHYDAAGSERLGARPLLRQKLGN